MINKRTDSNYLDVPITLRGNLQAFLIIGNRKFMIYCMLTKGKLTLRDSKTTSSSRSVEINKGDIVCLSTDPKTGYEEFCLLDKNGQTTSRVEFRHSIPTRLREWVQGWCDSRQELISTIKEGKLELPKKILDVKRIRIPKKILEEKFRIDIENDIIVED